MPRKSRKNIYTSFFHIMVQGINKEYIFKSDKYKKKYLEILKKANDNININIIAYCIMTNHAHFLIRCDDIEKVSYLMKKTNTSYAKYYNNAEKRVGYVFRDRYKIQEIMNQKHLYLCADYIHNNPIKAKMCATPKEYEYSSFSKIYKGNREKLFETIDEVLNKEKIKNNQKYNNDKAQNDNIIFIEENQGKEEICEDILNEYINKMKINKEDLIKSKENLIDIVVKLKIMYNISYRVMEKSLGLSRETLRKIVTTNQKNYNKT